jgi:hypothetical protein
MAAISAVAWKTAQPFPLMNVAARRALTPALSQRERELSERAA